jgi:hypothetical protein
MKSANDRKSKYTMSCVKLGRQTSQGGQILVDGLLRKSGVWAALARSPALLEASTEWGAPETLAASVIFMLTCGGNSLADIEQLVSDSVLLETLRLDAAAGAERVAAWLEALTPECVDELSTANTQLVRTVLEAAAPERVRTPDGLLTVTYEDTSIRADGLDTGGPCGLDRQGNLYQLQCALWCGPFLVEVGIDSPDSNLGRRLNLLQRHRDLWKNRKSHFIAKSHAFHDLQIMDAARAGFVRWSMLGYMWRGLLSRNAAAHIPETEWKYTTVRLPGLKESYAWLGQPLGGMAYPQVFAVSRRPAPAGEDSPYLYSFVAHGPGMSNTPAGVFAELRAFWKEAGAPPPLPSLGIHHPPCRSVAGNNAYYALGALAYNAVMALKVLELPDACQSWKAESVRRFLNVPGEVIKHANRHIFRLDISHADHLEWWENTTAKLLKPQKGGAGAGAGAAGVGAGGVGAGAGV